MRKLIVLISLLSVVPAFAQLGAYTKIRTAGTLPSSCVVGGFIQKTGSSAGIYFCSAPNTWSGPLLLTAGSGTVTSIATTSPITGGTITTTGTIACATCVVASSPGAGIAHFAGSTQTVTSSTIATADIAANAVTSAKLAVVNTRRTCMMPVGDGTNTVASGDYSPFKAPRCFIPYAATIIEVTLQCNAGTPSIQFEKRNGASTVTDLLSAALAANGTTKTCAMTSTSGTCIDGTTSSGSITISTTSISAGDYLEIKSGTASTENRCDAAITFTVN
jgi:hypothetical protein